MFITLKDQKNYQEDYFIINNQMSLLSFFFVIQEILNQKRIYQIILLILNSVLNLKRQMILLELKIFTGVRVFICKIFHIIKQI